MIFAVFDASLLTIDKMQFLAWDVIYTSRDYATMQCPSARLSVTEVHWHIIANLGFKF